jgi:hypothetical protein
MSEPGLGAEGNGRRIVWPAKNVVQTCSDPGLRGSFHLALKSAPPKFRTRLLAWLCTRHHECLRRLLQGCCNCVERDLSRAQSSFATDVPDSFLEVFGTRIPWGHSQIFFCSSHIRLRTKRKCVPEEDHHPKRQNIPEPRSSCHIYALSTSRQADAGTRLDLSCGEVGVLLLVHVMATGTMAQELADKQCLI